MRLLSLDGDYRVTGKLPRRLLELLKLLLLCGKKQHITYGPNAIINTFSGNI